MKRIDIEDLLKWAYREELPKEGASEGSVGGGGGWGPMTDFATLWTIVDVNRYGVVALTGAVANTSVHPDALAVHAAVGALDDLAVDLPEGWNPMPELDALGAHGAMAVQRALNRLTVIDAGGVRRLKREMSSLLRRHAILGGCPDGAGGVPTLEIERGEGGGPLWFRKVKDRYYDDDGTLVQRDIETADGWDKFRKRPKRGAYQKHYLDPDPVDTLVARGEYELWRTGLCVVRDSLAGRLEAHEVTGPVRPVAPWERSERPDMPRQPVVLRDLRISA